jgi:hypothetical protein
MCMMGRTLAMLAAVVLAAGLAPTSVRAESASPAAYDLATRQTDVMSAGEYDGRLKIRIFADGIVTGTFWDTEGRFSPVSGGLDGIRIWLDLGLASPTGERLFTGTFENGKLVAGAQHRSGLRSWTLEGSPASH